MSFLNKIKRAFKKENTEIKTPSGKEVSGSVIELEAVPSVAGDEKSTSSNEGSGDSAFFRTHFIKTKEAYKANIEQNSFPLRPKLVSAHGMDSGAVDLFNSTKAAFSVTSRNVPDELLDWYVTQGFIGYQACAIIAQNWLVNKACTVPARDALKRGWELSINDGTEVDDEVIAFIKKRDKKLKIGKTLLEFERHRRIFGIRIALPIVNSNDDDYYVKPFNIDGVKPGTYKGISQVDPYWITPELDADAVANPASLNFYEPTYWRVSGRRIHRSHLIITRYSEVTDVLKPTYLYGGLPLTQLLYERVYASERTANEAPLLAMSKRLTVINLDLEAAASNPDKFGEQMAAWVAFRDNFGIRIVGGDESIQQFDTSLAELDAVIMTQFQLVASIANMPATKLLGTSPKGFNATGEHEIETYYDELESIQTDTYDPLLARHYELLIKSEVDPKFNTGIFDLDVVWNPLKSPSDKELAEIREIDSRTDINLFNMGAIDGSEVRDKIIADDRSGYNGILPYEDEEEHEQQLESNTQNISTASRPDPRRQKAAKVIEEDQGD